MILETSTQLFYKFKLQLPKKIMRKKINPTTTAEHGHQCPSFPPISLPDHPIVSVYPLASLYGKIFLLSFSLLFRHCGTTIFYTLHLSLHTCKCIIKIQHNWHFLLAHSKTRKETQYVRKVKPVGSNKHLSPQNYLTSGAIQNGVPTEVFRRCQVPLSWAETPGKKRQD